MDDELAHLNPDSIEILKKIGEIKNDSKIDLMEASLALASLWRPSVPLDRYHDHINTMIQAAHRIDTTELVGIIDSVNQILFEEEGYAGNYDDYENPDNANMIFVIDHRKGLPVALGLLMTVLVRAVPLEGLEVTGLNFPGHFILRFELNGERIMVDPFHQGKLLEASDLRSMIKSFGGDQAELSAEFYQAVGNRDFLLRLQNNIKMRLVRDEQYKKALECVEAMRLFAPDDERLLFDAGILYSKQGHFSKALDCLALYETKVESDLERSEIKAIILELRRLITSG